MSVFVFMVANLVISPRDSTYVEVIRSGEVCSDAYICCSSQFIAFQTPLNLTLK